MSSTTGESFTLDGMVQDGAAVGAMSDASGGVFFMAALEGGKLNFAMVEPNEYNMPDYDTAQVIVLERSAAVPEPEASVPPAAKGRVDATTQATGRSPGPDKKKKKVVKNKGKKPSGGSTYNHAIGFSFTYPKGWKLEDKGDFLQMTPPSPGANAQGPTEVYGLGSQGLAGTGVTSITDPTALAYLDQAISQLSPALKRVGEPRVLQWEGGDGVLLSWEGQLPDGGSLSGRLYGAVIGEYAVFLFGLGLKKKVDGRSSDLASMFSSFSMGKGKTDPAIAGTWTLFSTSSITNNSVWETDYSRAKMVTDSNATLALGADGQFSRVDSSHTIAGAGDVWLENKSSDTESGRWYAGDGKLSLVNDKSGWTEYQYQLRQGSNGAELLLKADGKLTVWKRQ